MATMAQLNALSFIANPLAAEHFAAFLWDAANGNLTDDGSSSDRAIRRTARQAAKDILKLHGIEPTKVLLLPTSNGDGDAPPHADPPTYNES